MFRVSRLSLAIVVVALLAIPSSIQGNDKDESLSELINNAVEETKETEELKKLINDATKLQAAEQKADILRDETEDNFAADLDDYQLRVEGREDAMEAVKALSQAEKWKFATQMWLRLDNGGDLQGVLPKVLPDRVKIEDLPAWPTSMPLQVECSGGKAQTEATTTEQDKHCASDFTYSHEMRGELLLQRGERPVQPSKGINPLYRFKGLGLSYRAPFSNVAQCRLIGVWTFTTSYANKHKFGSRKTNNILVKHVVHVDFGVFRAYARDSLQDAQDGRKSVTGLPFITGHHKENAKALGSWTEEELDRMTPSARARVERGRGFVKIPVFNGGKELLAKSMLYRLTGPTMTYRYGARSGYVDVRLTPHRLWRPQRGDNARKMVHFKKPQPSSWLSHNNCPLIFAHRAAASALEPENRYDSLATTLEYADGVEFDVFLARNSQTGESEVLVFHDKDLERVFGVEFDNLAIRVDPKVGADKKTKWGKRRAMKKHVREMRDVGKAGITRMNDLFARKAITEVTACHPLPTLQQFLANVKKAKWDKGTPFKINIELKPGDPRKKMWKTYRADLARGVAKVLKDPTWASHLKDIIVTSFDPWKIKEINKLIPGLVQSGTATVPGLGAGILRAIDKVFRVSKSRVGQMRYDQITRRRVDALHKKGLPVGTFTLYDSTKSPRDASYKWEAVSNLVVSGVDWIETDDTLKLRETLQTLCGLYNNNLLTHKPKKN